MGDMQRNRSGQKLVEKKEERSFIYSGIIIEGVSDLLSQISKKRKMEDLYFIKDTPSVIEFALKTAFYLPSILWKLRKIATIRSQRFWYLNRKNEVIEGIMYGPDDDSQLPLIAFDSGYKRDLFNFSIVGKMIACLGYRTFSVRSKNELKSIEADDYMDAFNFLRTKYDKRHIIKDEGAFIGLSGGNIVTYKACSSEEFVVKHNIRCGISISPFSDLAEQFEYMKKKIKERDISPNALRVLEDYNRYVESLGVTDTSDREIFVNGSPSTYCKDIRVPLLIEHGITDDIVPAFNSLRLYKLLKKEKKDVQLVLIPGKGIHGDLKEWKNNIVDTIGLISSIIYAYKFLKDNI